MLSSHLILSRSLLPLSSIFPSIRVFSNELALHIRWPKFWSFSISPSNEYSGLISFRMDWFDLLAVQGTLKIFSSTTISKHKFKKKKKESISSPVLSHLYGPTFPSIYMTTGKTIALTIQTFVGKVTSQLFNTLSRFVIAFLSRSKCLLISWL